MNDPLHHAGEALLAHALGKHPHTDASATYAPSRGEPNMADAPSPGPAVDRLLLFVPMYNCAPQIGRVFARFTPSIQRLFAGALIIDNGSHDGSVEAAIAATAELDLPVSLVRNKENFNLGGSHKVAFNHALDHGYTHVVVLHGDDQADIRDIAPLLRRGLHRRADCLLGSRFGTGARREGYSTLRTAGNWAFNLLFSAAAHRPLIDLGSGLNCFATAPLADRFYLTLADDLTFNYHLILAIAQRRLRYRFFPITWREEDQVSNVKLLRQAMRALQIVGGYTLEPRAYLARPHADHAPDAYRATLLHQHPRRAAA